MAHGHGLDRYTQVSKCRLIWYRCGGESRESNHEKLGVSFGKFIPIKTGLLLLCFSTLNCNLHGAKATPILLHISHLCQAATCRGYDHVNLFIFTSFPEHCDTHTVYDIEKQPSLAARTARINSWISQIIKMNRSAIFLFTFLFTKAQKKA